MDFTTLQSNHCPVTGKVMYGTKQTAKRIAKRVKKKMGKKQRPYRCRLCDFWHLFTTTSGQSRISAPIKDKMREKGHAV